MARDHRKLRVLGDAHRLVLAIYNQTRDFPRDEWYALRLQIRKAAVSVPSNIVEGNARRTTREYVHFLNVARASAADSPTSSTSRRNCVTKTEDQETPETRDERPETSDQRPETRMCP